MHNLPVDAGRLWADVMDLALCTDPERPFTRRAFSARFLEGREIVAAKMRAAGLAVRLDAAGNLIGRREGRRPGLKAIVVGSHTDTVPDGGRFDGIAGVATGLEIARALADRGIALDHPLEVYDCLAEEVSPYGVSCIGSRAVAGCLTDTLLARTDEAGEPLVDGIRRMGGRPEALADAGRDDVAAFLELHIEQGVVLEGEGIDVGVVTAIAGITRVAVDIAGRADHAGTTPMDRRADALVAAADLVRAVRDLASIRALSLGRHFAATVGEHRMLPNAANVVPAAVSMLVDIRSETAEDRDGFLAALRAAAERAATDHPGVTAEVSPVSDNPPAPADPALQADIAAAAAALGLSSRPMASGAGHDMAWFSRIAPAAMVFVPSREGRSHTPEEWTDPDQLARGAAVMFEAVVRADRRLDSNE